MEAEEQAILLDSCGSGDRAAVEKLLIGRAIDPSWVDSAGCGPLHHAAGNGHVDLCALLIERQAQVRAVDGGGRAAMHRACDGGHLEVCALLVEFGADMNAADAIGRTPLAHAAASTAPAAEELCEWLRHCGATLEATAPGDAATTEEEPPLPKKAPPQEEEGAPAPSAQPIVLATIDEDHVEDELPLPELPTIDEDEIVDDSAEIEEALAGRAAMRDAIETMRIDIPEDDDDDDDDIQLQSPAASPAVSPPPDVSDAAAPVPAIAVPAAAPAAANPDSAAPAAAAAAPAAAATAPAAAATAPAADAAAPAADAAAPAADAAAPAVTAPDSAVPAAAPPPLPDESSFDDETREKRRLAQEKIARSVRARHEVHEAARAVEAARLAAEAAEREQDLMLRQTAAKEVMSAAVEKLHAIKAAKEKARREREAREAAEEAAKREAEMEKMASAAAEAEEAKEAADQRVKNNTALPPAFFALPTAQRELLSAVLFHAQAAQRHVVHAVRARPAARVPASACLFFLHAPALSPPSLPHRSPALLSPHTAMQADLEMACVALANPKAGREIWASHPTPGAARAVATSAALDALPAAERATVTALGERARASELPLVELQASEPLELTVSDAKVQEFFSAEGICQGYTFPPEARRCWEWAEWWAGTLALGARIGRDFEKGLMRALGGIEVLDARALVGGHRPTSLTAIGLVLRALTSLDLRDNRVTDSEAEVLAGALKVTGSLVSLNLAGNRITSKGAAPLGDALLSATKSAKSFCDLDLSRNQIGAAAGAADANDGLLGIGNAASNSATMKNLILHHVRMGDSVGARVAVAFASNRPQRHLWATAAEAHNLRKTPIPPTRALMKLDLSHNNLSVGFAEAFSEALAECPALTVVDLKKNSLGVDGGRAIASALIETKAKISLKLLDLSYNNLCNADASFANSTLARGEWDGDAIFALMDALIGGAVVHELALHGNMLCGLWPEHVCGSPSARGTYTTIAIDAILTALERERLSVRPSKEGFRVDALVKFDFLRRSDEKRLLEALRLNGRKPVKVVGKSSAESSGPAGAEKRLSSAGQPGGLRGDSFRDGSQVFESFREPSGERSFSIVADASPAAVAKRKSVLDTPSLATAVDLKDAPNSKSPLKAKPLAMPLPAAEREIGAMGLTDRPENGDDDDGNFGASPRAAGESPASARKVTETKGKKGVPALRAVKGALEDGDGKSSSNPFAADKKGRKAGSESPRGKALNSARKKSDSDSGTSTSKGSSTPRSSKSSSSGSSGLTPRGGRSKSTGESAAKAAAESSSSSGAATDRPRATTSTMGRAGEKKKKKKEEVVVEEVKDPFADAPMMIAMTQLKATKEADLKSSPVGTKVMVGSLMRVAETKKLDDSTERMFIALDGDSEALGWVTGITSDLVENLRLAAAGFPLEKSTRTLICREGKDNASKKLDDIPKETMLRIIERATMSDGTEKALVARDGAVAETLGWVTVSKPGKDESTLVPIKPLELSFDLKVHTSEALVAALNRRKATGGGVQRRNKKDGAMPFQPAGRRPPNRVDQDTPSRHRLVEERASLVMMLNCHGAAFEITSWTGDRSFDKLPGEQQFDLVSKVSRKRLGMVRLAKELGMPFLERVDFPDDWIPSEEHGLQQDGWQGAGYIDLELTWDKDVATMRVHPWLSFGCSVGARFLIRKVGSGSGQSATVQRILADDRVVARVDGFSKLDGVKGETIVDLQPSTVVRTTMPGYARDQRILLLHNQKLVDAVVLKWLGSTNLEEGSRHMVNLKPPNATVGAQSWAALNMHNHVVLTGHAVGLTAEAFEAIRYKYCHFLASNEDKVEDAITGNSLEIKDQLIFMAAQNVTEGCNPAEYMVLQDVPQLVKLLVMDSPKRSNGAHAAQPVLCRAGPGTGKTWMVKQSLFLLAVHLCEKGEGVRLVPCIVFVQRIVRLLRELGDEPETLLADPEGMMRWYISNEFADRKEERSLLLLAYDMRALVILLDGVDEAAGLRDIVESFVHYELVPSGNRMVVTSRPEGVDLEDYKTRFVVMNLTELSQEQQRNVIQMQLQGNAFFEHLVNIAECRKDLDKRYKEAFRTEAMRNEIEAFGFEKVEDEAPSSPDGKDQPKSPDGKSRASKEDVGQEAVAVKSEKPTSPGKGEKPSAKPLEDAAAAAAAGGRRGSVLPGQLPGLDARRGSVLAVEAPKVEEVERPPIPRRRLFLDNQQDLQDWLSKCNLRVNLRSSFLDPMNKAMVKTNRTHGPVLDHLETDIRQLSNPCTRSGIQGVIEKLEKARSMKSSFATDVHESLMQLALARKQPQQGGRRGAKAAPIPLHGLWYQVIQICDPKYQTMQEMVPTLGELLANAASSVGIKKFGVNANSIVEEEEEGDEEDGEEDEGNDMGASTAGSTPTWFTYRDPVGLWINSTYAGATEPTERLPEPWCAKARMVCQNGDQVLNLLKRLQQSVELKIDGETVTLAVQSLNNAFNPESLHPTHLRNVECDMLLTYGDITVAVLVQVEHTDLLTLFDESKYHRHYDYFCDRVLLVQDAFNVKFEALLIFLVEAIGVPVLLSLLLLTYSNTTGGDTLDLDDLPQDRLQLYKYGIMSGIRKRLLLVFTNADATAAEAEVKEEEQAADARPRREKRKGALELTMGGGVGGGTVSAASGSDDKAKAKINSNEPILDLNSVLRGKKVRIVTGEEDVAEAYSLVVRVLDKYGGGKGVDLRTAITAVVPKSHSMHAPVTALVEYVIAPIGQQEKDLMECGKKMLRRVAVDNQQNGRREFTSKNVACALGAYPEELGLWTRLELDHEHGIALTATLAKQSDKAPAQYQFKHLSFQEGLYAEHLLILVTSLAPPQGPGWNGWASDQASADFLNNRYMNNTCRIAAGHLGALLAKQRSAWDFREAPLTPNGRSALWFITDENERVESINVSNNDVSSDDVVGLARMIATCPALKSLDLSDNDMQRLTVIPTEWMKVGDALAGNSTLTALNLNSNRLGGVGTRIVSRALVTCVGLQRLGLSFNEPGVEPALAELMRVHPALTSVELVEALDRHLPSRAKDEVGRALSENPAKTVGFMHCDTFVLSEETKSLVWPKEASTSDAVLLAGVLVTNTVLTTFNIASGAQLANSARSSLGEALLNNPGARVAFCNDFGLTPSTDTCEFDLSRTELKDVEPFRLLAGCLRGNRTLTHVTLKQLRSEQIPTLALALRGNSTLAQLDIIHVSRLGGQTIVRLPVPELNGSSKTLKDPRSVDMSATCIEGHIGRVACEMIGTLIAANTTLETLNLSNTGLGQAIGNEGEGGHILLRPLCDSKECPLRELNLSNIQLNDKAGAKFLSSLSQGLGKKMPGYEKITSLSLASNELGKTTGSMLKELLWGERAPCMLKFIDLSGNLTLDGYDTALAIKRNISLTSVDLRNIPSANTEQIYSFLGSFLLHEECQCRLGFLSCDAFQLVHDQTDLTLKDLKIELHAGTNEGMGSPESPVGGKVSFDASASKNGKDSNAVPSSVLMLLAGVVKFNSSLTNLGLQETGFDDTAAGYFYTALCENKVLKQLDLSGNPVDSVGIAELAEGVRHHPTLETIKVDGKIPLNVAQLRGSKGTESTLDMADSGLGHLSGYMIGAITGDNKTLVELNIKSNSLGASGAAAVIAGLGDSPILRLDLTRNNIGDGDVAALSNLAVSICQKCGALVDLKLDENELDCPATALQPICKLRNLRKLSMEKNKLNAIPSFVGTMTSLRTLQLHTNMISELPGSVCLLVGLEALDLHKNQLKVLPVGIGLMRNLQKLDLSENRLVELPPAICELQDTLQLSVGRNPLEKPSIEQARQGIGSIRRFFGYSKAREVAPDDEKPITVGARDEEADAKQARRRPTGRAEGAPSRHDWAGPASVILLFNCFNCNCALIEGGHDLASISSDETVDLIAGFNLQKVGRLREGKKVGETWQDRIELNNEWLPWRTADIQPGEAPTLTVVIRWTVTGVGKQSASVLLTPFLSYGVSLGARIKHLQSGSYATVMRIREDDFCDVIVDNAASQNDDNNNPGRMRIDLRPDTCLKTPSPSYKPGQKLLLLLDASPVDAIVEEWLGLRRGSRHRVRLGAQAGKGADGKAATRVSKETSVSKETVEVDLNESNHTKLLFSSVKKYEDARVEYCEKLMTKHLLVDDMVASRQLKILEQRIFAKPTSLDPTPPEVEGGEEKGEDTEDKNSPDASPDGARKGAESPTPGQYEGKRGRRSSFEMERMRNKQSTKDADRAKAGSPGAGAETSSPPSSPDVADTRGLGMDFWMQHLSIHAMISELLDGKTKFTVIKAKQGGAGTTVLPSVLVRSTSKAAHEMLFQQAMCALASSLRDAPSDSAVRLVPLAVSMARIAELLADETTAKLHPRALVIKAFEMDYPGHAEVLKQAMEMRALVIVADVRDEADLAGLTPQIVEELALNRLFLTCCLPTSSEKLLGDVFPSVLIERSEAWKVETFGLMLSELKLTSKHCTDIFKRLRMRGEGGDSASAHYSQVETLHLAGADLGKDGKSALPALQELLGTENCSLTSLDLSFTQFDGYSLLQAIRQNSSVTSLDVRKVVGMDKLYQTLSEILLDDRGRCRLGCLRCDAFDVLEGATALSYKEHFLENSEMLVLAGLVKHNLFAQSLDLTATDMGPPGAKALAGVLNVNRRITSVNVAFNPGLNAEAKDALQAAANARVDPALQLEL